MTDFYGWLRDRDDPAVTAYLQAENEYLRRATAPLQPLCERLYDELAGRVVETDATHPEPAGAGWLYYRRTDEGRSYRRHCRRRALPDASEEPVLDENVLAAGRSFFTLGACLPSRCHRYVLYTFDDSGDEHFDLRIRDLATGRDLPDVIADACAVPVWSPDGAYVFYVVRDGTERPCRVMRHRVGTDPAADVVVHDEVDDAFHVKVGRTKDWSWLLVTCSSTNADEVLVLDGATPDGAFAVFARRRPWVKYSLYRRGDEVYILTNHGAPNFQLCATTLGAPSRRRWRVVVPHRPSVRLDGVDVFARHLVVYERRDTQRAIRFCDLASGGAVFRPVALPEDVSYVRTLPNDDFEATTLRFTFTSLVTTATVYELDMNSGTLTAAKRLEVRGGYDPARYRAERHWVRARDGVEVPLSLVYRPDLRRPEGNPVYMTGYGAYGIPYDPEFSPHWLSLLDRGFVVAIAQVRGGEDRGRSWYEQGRRFGKLNTFRDFIACAQYLVDTGVTRRRRIAIQGISAGGLLVCAVTNMRPGLFGAVVAKVPFVDAVTTMLDPDIPLTTEEWDEWGNPQDKKAFDYIMRYSPADNVRPHRYPPMLVTAGLNDTRVGYWEPAKFVAKLRRLKTDDNVLLLKTHMGSGHGGPSDRYAKLRDLAFEYAFILTALAVEA